MFASWDIRPILLTCTSIALSRSQSLSCFSFYKIRRPRVGGKSAWCSDKRCCLFVPAWNWPKPRQGWCAAVGEPEPSVSARWWGVCQTYPCPGFYSLPLPFGLHGCKNKMPWEYIWNLSVSVFEGLKLKGRWSKIQTSHLHLVWKPWLMVPHHPFYCTFPSALPALGLVCVAYVEDWPTLVVFSLSGCGCCNCLFLIIIIQHQSTKSYSSESWILHVLSLPHCAAALLTSLIRSSYQFIQMAALASGTLTWEAKGSCRSVPTTNSGRS